MTTPLRRHSPISFTFPGLAILGALSFAAPAIAAPPEEEAATNEDTNAPADAAAEAAEGPSESLAEPPAEEAAPADEAIEPPAEGPAEAEPIEAEPAEPVDPKKPSAAMGDKHSITYTSLLAPRVNPLGLEERLWIGYQYRLYNKDKTILNGSNIGIIFRPIVSPAIALIGATFQFQPAAVLRLRATYSYVAWFGTFQFMQSFQSPHDDFSETRLDALADDEQNYSTTGHQVELEALVQARYKGLVLRSTTVANYNSYKLRGDDDLFYDIRVDALVPNNGWVLFNDTDLIWLQELKGPRKASILAGGRVSVLKSFYPDSVYEPGDVLEDPNGPQLKVGPEIGYIFYDKPERKFNRPTLLLIPQWNVMHRWRTGRDVSSAMPTIALAFVFTGQLWGKN